MDWKKWKSLRLQENLEETIKTRGLSYSQMKEELDKLRDSTFIFFDTETMGFNPEFDQITQIGFDSVSYQDGKEGEKEENNIRIKLTDQSKERLQDGSPENLRWKESNAAQAERVRKDPKLTDAQRKNNLKFVTDPYKVLRFTHIADKNNNLVNEGDIPEKQALEEFYNFVMDHQNVILVAHNSKFDIKMVNVRFEKYGMPKLEPGENIKEILDTLAVSREQHLPALQDLADYFKKQRSSIEGLENIDQMFASGKEKADQELAAREVDFHPEANIEDLSNQTMLAIQEMPEDEREKVLKVVLLNTLISSAENTYQSGRSTLSHLANSFKISAEGAHDAIADVRMLIKIYNNMYAVLDMAVEYLGEGAEALTDIQKKAMRLKEEMEPYQRIVTAKHPAAKARLTKGGKVKDKSTPYKVKLSLKRGKSAPPGFGGA